MKPSDAPQIDDLMARRGASACGARKIQTAPATLTAMVRLRRPRPVDEPRTPNPGNTCQEQLGVQISICLQRMFSIAKPQGLRNTTHRINKTGFLTMKLFAQGAARLTHPHVMGSERNAGFVLRRRRA